MNFINGIMEDICREIGFEAAVRLAAVHGSRQLYVPGITTDDHPLCKLLGAKPFAAFVALYGGETISVPKIESFDRWRRVRAVSELLSRGLRRHDIAKALGMSERQVGNLQAMAEDIGLIPLILATSPPVPQSSSLLPGAPA